VASVVPPAPKTDEPVAIAVYFDFDRSALRAGETSKLDELTAKLQGRTFERLDAVGYADRIGEEPYNHRRFQKARRSRRRLSDRQRGGCRAHSCRGQR
jgi:outer membrane protein OmpA-like peptidoglycan-associated protein